MYNVNTMRTSFGCTSTNLNFLSEGNDDDDQLLAIHSSRAVEQEKSSK